MIEEQRIILTLRLCIHMIIIGAVLMTGIVIHDLIREGHLIHVLLTFSALVIGSYLYWILIDKRIEKKLGIFGTVKQLIEKENDV